MIYKKIVKLVKYSSTQISLPLITKNYARLRYNNILMTRLVKIYDQIIRN